MRACVRANAARGLEGADVMGEMFDREGGSEEEVHSSLTPLEEGR